MSKDGSTSDSSSCWGNFLTLGTLLLILGGCLTLLSWSEMHTGSSARPSLDNPLRAISLLRRHFGSSSAAAADQYNAPSQPDDSSEADEASAGELRLSANSSGWHDLSGPAASTTAAAGAVQNTVDITSLLAAVDVANSYGLSLEQPSTNSSSKNSTAHGSSSSSSSSSNSTSSSSSSSNSSSRRSRRQTAPAAAAAAPAKRPAKMAAPVAVAAKKPPPPQQPKPAAAAAAAAKGAVSSSISSKLFGGGKSACTCLRADPAVLQKHCSVSDRGWPENNTQLVTDCFDLLVNKTSDYLQLQEHNPGKGVDCRKQLLMHTFWSGEMNWKLKAVIQSFLFTHYSNDTSCRPKPLLNVWLQTVDPTRSQLEKWAEEWDAPYLVCSDQLKFHQWRNDGWLDWLPPSMLAAAGNASNTAALHAAVRASAAAGSRVAYSDAVRFLVLYKFGGIYTDGDVLLLRNMEAFAHYDFLYEWSFVKKGMNTAVFGARQGSAFAGAVIQSALKTAAGINASTGDVTFDARLFNGAFHPLRVLNRVPAKIAAQVEALPSIPFDPVWLTYDTPDSKTHNLTLIHKVRNWKDFFDKPAPHIVPPRVPTDLFAGAFAHHWHNNWKAPFEEKSLFGRLVGAYEDFLHGKLPNRYGSKFVPCNAAVTPAATRRRRRRLVS